MFLYQIIDPFVKLVHWDWLAEINFATVTIRLLLAVICGGLIGVDRAIKHHAAGFRTYITVCLGSTIAMMTNDFLTQSLQQGDGARLGAQVISGIGFLGAGTIMFTSRNQVKGLTTAAGLWACACLGLAIGAGFYSLSIIATIVIVLVLALLPFMEKMLTKKAKQFTIHIEFYTRENLKDFINYIRENQYKILSLEHNPAYSGSGLSVYTIEIRQTSKDTLDHKEILNDFKKLSYIHYLEEIL